MTQLFDSHFDEVGLKATQFTVLSVLAYGSETRTVSKLADDLVLEQSSLSRNLAVLERLGYVKLEPGADRRERKVRLTRGGKAALTRGYPVWKRAQGIIEGALTNDFASQLRSLRKLTKAAKGAQGVRRPRV